MTTERHKRLPRLSLRTALARVGITSGVAALVLTAGLWIQMATGRDPALGAAERVADADASQRALPSAPAADSTDVGSPAPAPVQTTTS